MKALKHWMVAAAVSLPQSLSAESVLVIGTGGFVPFEGAQKHLAFVEPKIEEPEPSLTDNIDIPVRTARPEVLAAINEAGLRYALHDGVLNSRLSTLQWMALFRANIEIESGYDPKATSEKGAFGLGQLMPDTASDLGVNRENMTENLDGSARYLAQLLDQFGTKELALAAYNAGPGAVETHGGIPPYAETQGHVVKVVGVYQRIVTNGG